MPSLQTTSLDVCDIFSCTEKAAAKLTSWQNDPRRHDVVPVVLDHVTRVPYNLTPSSVQDTCARTEHALGEVNYSDVKNVRDAHDWSPPFSFSHVFHFLMEEIGRMPTWGEFVEFQRHDDRGIRMLGSDIQRRYFELTKTGLESSVAWDALHWRVGNAYYGIVRDIYTIVKLRSHGIDIRCHPLADTLFRADGWVGRTIISLLVSNQRYRAASRGRKTQPRELFDGATPKFRYETIELAAADKFGEVHLPRDQAVMDLVSKIGAANIDFKIAE